MGKVALLDVGAGIGNEAQVEGEVMDAGYLHGQQLLGLEQVMQVSLAVPAYRLAA